MQLKTLVTIDKQKRDEDIALVAKSTRATKSYVEAQMKYYAMVADDTKMKILHNIQAATSYAKDHMEYYALMDETKTCMMESLRGTKRLSLIKQNIMSSIPKPNTKPWKPFELQQHMSKIK